VDLDGRWHRSHGEERRRRSIEDERVGACVASRTCAWTWERWFGSGLRDQLTPHVGADFRSVGSRATYVDGDGSRNDH
jgi:hypothetical protein